MQNQIPLIVCLSVSLNIIWILLLITGTPWKSTTSSANYLSQYELHSDIPSGDSRESGESGMKLLSLTSIRGSDNPTKRLQGFCQLLSNNFDYNDDLPSTQAVIDLLQPWQSVLPPTVDNENLIGGKVPLFEDDRIKFFMKLNDAKNQYILELGPLEGGHTYMLTKAGAKVVAIEGSPLAYLKVLAVKDIYKLHNAQILFGDFTKFIAKAVQHKLHFDAVICVGVLYHMKEPMRLLYDISKITDRIIIWTQYYSDPPNPNYAWDSFNQTPNAEVGGYIHKPHCHTYQSRASGFLGGPAAKACWLERKDIIKGLKSFGFKSFSHLDESEEVERTHVHGAAFTFYASKF
jgi:hypothetical protein